MFKFHAHQTKDLKHVQFSEVQNQPFCTSWCGTKRWLHMNEDEKFLFNLCFIKSKEKMDSSGVTGKICVGWVALNFCNPH
jgi:hypothetical protein